VKDTYLIAGGAGFIGSNFVHLLSEKYPHAHIVVIDALTYAGNTENMKNVPHTFVQADIAEKQKIAEIFVTHKPKYVVNFAAETHVDRSILGPEIFVHTNVLGTQNLLEAAKNNGVERYLQISTDEVYGDLGDTTGTYFTEETPIDPNCPYAASKAGADLLVRSYFETYNFPTLITRCTNNYGPYQFPEKTHSVLFVPRPQKPAPSYVWRWKKHPRLALCP
jgi:dTDP-glucose 4,6-dehydratase